MSKVILGLLKRSKNEWSLIKCEKFWLFRLLLPCCHPTSTLALLCFCRMAPDKPPTRCVSTYFIGTSQGNLILQVYFLLFFCQRRQALGLLILASDSAHWRLSLNISKLFSLVIGKCLVSAIPSALIQNYPPQKKIKYHLLTALQKKIIAFGKLKKISNKRI